MHITSAVQKSSREPHGSTRYFKRCARPADIAKAFAGELAIRAHVRALRRRVSAVVPAFVNRDIS